MGLTTWRVYHAEVEARPNGYIITTFNMFGREIQSEEVETKTELMRKLRAYAKETERFTHTFI